MTLSLQHKQSRMRELKPSDNARSSRHSNQNAALKVHASTGAQRSVHGRGKFWNLRGTLALFLPLVRSNPLFWVCLCCILPEVRKLSPMLKPRAAKSLALGDSVFVHENVQASPQREECRGKSAPHSPRPLANALAPFSQCTARACCACPWRHRVEVDLEAPVPCLRRSKRVWRSCHG